MNVRKLSPSYTDSLYGKRSLKETIIFRREEGIEVQMIGTQRNNFAIVTMSMIGLPPAIGVNSMLLFLLSMSQKNYIA